MHYSPELLSQALENLSIIHNKTVTSQVGAVPKAQNAQKGLKYVQDVVKKVPRYQKGGFCVWKKLRSFDHSVLSRMGKLSSNLRLVSGKDYEVRI